MTLDELLEFERQHLAAADIVLGSCIAALKGTGIETWGKELPVAPAYRYQHRIATAYWHCHDRFVWLEAYEDGRYRACREGGLPEDGPCQINHETTDPARIRDIVAALLQDARPEPRGLGWGT